jgi:hypothetical protein
MLLRILHSILLTASLASAAEPSLTERLSNRDYPSVFQAWNDAAPVDGADAVTMQARHDLVFVHPSMVGLQSPSFEGTTFEFSPADLAKAKARRAALLGKNPHLILIAEIRYRDAPKGFIPEESPWWKRDAEGKYVMGWAEGGYRLLDVAHADWQAQVAKRAKAVMETGVFDGVMLDWWTDDEDRVNLIRRIRETIGKDALVLVNSNDKPIPRTAAQVNGLYMECYRTESAEDWKRISETLRWAEQTLRTPRINCLESWSHESRKDLHRMRAVTTLSLSQSDGYCLFGDPNDLPTPDHLHDWYPFWDKGLGRPLKPGVQRADGAWEREFTVGTVVYNPAGNPGIKVRFDKPRRSRATGISNIEHALKANDGDIFLSESGGK